MSRPGIESALDLLSKKLFSSSRRRIETIFLVEPWSRLFNKYL